MNSEFQSCLDNSKKSCIGAQNSNYVYALLEGKALTFTSKIEFPLLKMDIRKYNVWSGQWLSILVQFPSLWELQKQKLGFIVCLLAAEDSQG